MTEWKLSVRLTGQGSDLSRTLRNLSRDARAASRDINALGRDIRQLRDDARRDIRLKVTIDGQHLRRQVRDAMREASAGNRIQVPLHIDSRGLRAEVRRALAGASGRGLNVRLRVDAGRLRSEVRQAIRQASAGQRVRIPIGLQDPYQLRRDVRRAVRAASTGQRIRIPITGDNNTTTPTPTPTPVPTPDASASASASSTSVGLKGLLGISTTLLPIATALAPVIKSLAAGLGATALSMGAFGAAAAGQAKDLSALAEAEQAYLDAVKEHGSASAEAAQAQMAYQQQLASMPVETQKAAIALSNLKSDFHDWSDDMSRFTMAPLAKGFALIGQTLPHLSPEVQSFSEQLDRLLNVAGGAMSTPGFDAFADKVAKLTDTKLDSMTDQVIHLMRVLSEGDPNSGALGQILAYIRENGPAAREALTALGDALSTLIQGASQAGSAMLTLVTMAARLVAAMPPELVAIILQTVTALKLLQLAGAGAATIAGGITRVRTAIAGLSAASAAAGGGLAGLRAAFLSLGTAAKASVVVAGIALAVMAIDKLSSSGKNAPPDVDKLTSSLQRLGSTGKATGEAAKVFGSDLDGLYGKVRSLTDPTTTDSIQQFLVGWTGWDSTPVKNAKENLEAVDTALAGMVKNGQADQAAEAVKRLTAEYGKGGRNTKEFTSQLDDYKSAVADAKFEQELVAQSMGVFGDAAQRTSAQLDAQKKSAEGLRQAIQALNDAQRTGLGGMIGFEAAIDAASKAAKENAGALSMSHGELNLNSEKARNAATALNDLAAKTDEAASSARESGASWDTVNGIYERGRSALVSTAQQMGLTKTQANQLADSILTIPDKKTMSFEMRTEDAISGLDKVIAQIQATPDKKSVTVSALTGDAITLLESLGYKVTALPNGQFKVTAETGTAKTNLDNLQHTRDGLKDKTLKLNADTISALNGLNTVAAKIKATPGAKSVTVKTLNGQAIAALEAVGYKTRTLKDGRVVVTGRNGQALGAIGAVQAARDRLSGKTITITTIKRTVLQTVGAGPKTTADALRAQARALSRADGGVTDYYANGGIQRGGLRYFAGGAESHVAQFAPSGTWRVWAEPETGGEAYIPLAPSKRRRSKKIAEETVRRLGGKGIAWNADGSILDQPGVQAFASGGFTYKPTGQTLGGLGDPKQRVDKLVSDLREAWRQYNEAVKELGRAKGSKAKAAARRKVAAERADIAEINAALGQSKYAKAPAHFDLSNYMKQLSKSAAATKKWRASLQTIAARGGQDVADLLENMGEEGYNLVNRLATASGKHFDEIVKNLKTVAGVANATLKDYTKQLNDTNKVDAAFQKNLIKLAGMGYGALANQLAGQNDTAAQQLAAEAVKSPSAAGRANTAAATQAKTLSSDELADLVQIIAAIKTAQTGIHQVAAATGLGEDDIITIANKASSQIKSSLGSRSTQFLADLARANQHLSYANGGIRSGIYATRGGAVTFAEPSTGGEAYIPLGRNKRGSATAVLGDVAGRFGLGLTSAQAARPVVIVKSGDTVTIPVTAVRTGASASDIGAQVGRSYRRARRGGVAARG